MKVYWGETKNACEVVTYSKGYWLDQDGQRSFVKRPANVHRAVARMYGVQVLGGFVGIMRFCNPVAFPVEPT